MPERSNDRPRDPHRLVDACANRAREGLRVMEDIARFLLDDPLAGDLKDARDELRVCLERAGCPAGVLLAHRDTPGDVGTGMTSEGEAERASVHQVAVAAGKRAGEALRSLEEAVKLAGVPGSFAGFKALRYRVYELERRLVVGLGSPARRQWRVCVLITESLCAHHGWEEVAMRALDAGVDALQLREKALADRELLARARALVEMARPSGGAVVVNDRADIAVLAGAHGVHLGQDDLTVGDVRKLAGSGLIVGVSASTPEQAIAAAGDGADVIGIGAMFPTMTKRKDRIAGPGLLRACLGDARVASVPHLAIGGITAENVGEAVDAGARGVAVSGAVCGAQDPGSVCAALLEGVSGSWGGEAG